MPQASTHDGDDLARIADFAGLYHRQYVSGGTQSVVTLNLIGMLNIETIRFG